MQNKIIHVVGARPNFMKVAPVVAALAKKNIKQLLVHTGQHYDKNMSEIFFQQLGIPEPDINLEVGSASHAVQTAEIIMRFEKVVDEHKPQLVLVYGDVNSTVAAAIVCSKLLIPIGHVEAGLRSFDRTMPEEVNRLLTDQVADLLFTPSTDGDCHLKKEGIDTEKIFFVGNVMIDTLVRLLPKARERWEQVNSYSLDKGNYVLVTLHRPSNVDTLDKLKEIVTCLGKISQKLPVIFPVHPRTKSKLKQLDVEKSTQLHFVDPLSYLDFLCLQDNAKVVLTDSGGVQEETTYLGTPCLTLRPNTERPVTVDVGTNVLVGEDLGKLQSEFEKILQGNAKKGEIPPLWDGKASERIAEIIMKRNS